MMLYQGFQVANESITHSILVVSQGRVLVLISPPPFNGFVKRFALES